MSTIFVLLSIVDKGNFLYILYTIIHTYIYFNLKYNQRRNTYYSICLHFFLNKIDFVTDKIFYQ